MLRRRDTAPLPSGVRRAIVLSDSPVMRAGVRSVMPQRGVEVVAELDGWGRLLDAVRATSAQFVIAAPTDGGSQDLFRTLDALPAGCAAVLLLPVPGFRIQASTIGGRFDIVCLPLNVNREELLAGMRKALQSNGSGLTVQELCSGAHGTLTAREQEVLSELAQGKSNRDIAEALWVSADTVKTHLRRIYHKLGVSTRSEAVALYISQLGKP